MRRVRSAVLIFAVVAGSVGPGAPPASVQGQAAPCIAGGDHTPVQLGTPDANGITREERLGSPGEKKGFRFTVAKEGSGFVYVGDQWYDLDLFMYYRGACPPGQWEELARAWSVRAERRSLQFVRPDEQIVLKMLPGDYVVIVGHKYAEDPQFARDFNPERGFTFRVTMNAPVCKVDPPDEMVPNPLNEAVMMPKRPDAALYQLAITMEPDNPGPFSLMTFNAVVSPPYSDLFDFDWAVDGQPAPQALGMQTLQMPSMALQKTPDNTHKVAVRAKGARQYPDPDQPHIPLDGGALIAECSFKLGTT